MKLENTQIARVLLEAKETFEKVRPGKRVVGENSQGEHRVFPTEDVECVLGLFDTSEEAEAFAASPEIVESLVEVIKSLTKDRDEALRGLAEIYQAVEPAYDAFEQQQPVDMGAVLKVSNRWCSYLLGRNGSIPPSNEVPSHS